VDENNKAENNQNNIEQVKIQEEEYIFDPNDQNYIINEKKKKLKKLKEERQKENEYHLKEKEDLLKKLHSLENQIFQGSNIEKINENERKKFKEYREGQLKQREEKNKKKQMIEAKKKEEEELLTIEKQYNDVQSELSDKKKIISKLNEKIKFLDGEIRDLRYENERDKDDMMFSIKELTKENKLYYGILRTILTENEIKKIIDFSTWKEDNEDWKIHPFSINPKDKNQALKFPQLKQHQST